MTTLYVDINQAAPRELHLLDHCPVGGSVPGVDRVDVTDMTLAELGQVRACVSCQALLNDLVQSRLQPALNALGASFQRAAESIVALGTKAEPPFLRVVKEEE